MGLYKANQTSFKKGYTMSPEIKLKISLSTRGKDKPWLKGRASSFKGRKHTLESKEKIRISHLGKPRILYISKDDLGKRISESKKGIKVPKLAGTNNFKWIQDRSKLKRYNDDAKDRRSYSYTYWRKKVWERDHFICRYFSDDCKGRIEAHHILGWKEYPELRYQINNGITLCHAHHPRKRAEEKRLVADLQRLVSVSKG